MKNNVKTQRIRYPQHTVKNRRKQKRAHSSLHFFLSVFFLAAVISILSAGTLLSSASETRTENPVYFQYYKNITVQDGDTLHGLAKIYNQKPHQSDNAYVKELKELNHMKSSGLIPGQSFIIIYYDTVYK